jgi:hypothetical protein
MFRETKNESNHNELSISGIKGKTISVATIDIKRTIKI